MWYQFTVCPAAWSMLKFMLHACVEARHLTLARHCRDVVVASAAASIVFIFVTQILVESLFNSRDIRLAMVAMSKMIAMLTMMQL